MTNAMGWGIGQSATAPEIPGYEYLETLGSGGFADVYVYEQAMPRRRVAIKVLRPERVTDEVRRLFRDEIDFLARLSAHPNIVTLHHAGTLPDGRLFLALEYCSRPGLGARFRNEAFAVPDVLAIGVQLADAIETAHRAGVLHRDIKPGNVLVTDYGRPALTDFGIAATLGRGATARAAGMSLPWAAPESLDSGWSGPETDVWGLAATLVSLLTGRTPFERPGESVSSDDLADRIRDEELPPFGRSDVPPELDEVLRTAMSKSPHGRYTSALAFARALQRVQHQLGLPVTDIDVSGGGSTATGSMPRAGGFGTQGGGYGQAGAVPPTRLGAAREQAGAGAVGASAAPAASTPHPTTPIHRSDFDSLLLGDDDDAPVQLGSRSAPAFDARTQAVPMGGGATQLRAPGTSTGHAWTPVADHAATPSPNFVSTVKPPSRVPGIVLDVLLGLGVIGAVLYLVLG